MKHVPLPTVIVADDATGASLTSPAWHALQQALGEGLATAVVQTPEMRGDTPALHHFTPNRTKRPNIGGAKLRRLFKDLLCDWRLAFETLLNRRWSLCDNPYAKVWIVPGALVIHEDPLSWVIDARGEDIYEGTPFPARTPLAMLIPVPTSNHLKRAIEREVQLPHAASLDRALAAATREAEMDGLLPLTFRPRPVNADRPDIIAITNS